MNDELKPDSQVTVRQRLVGGMNLIKTGRLISIDAQAGFGLVKFQNEPVNKRIPLANMEPINKRYRGRASVHPNPTFRNNRG